MQRRGAQQQDNSDFIDGVSFIYILNGEIRWTPVASFHQKLFRHRDA